MKIVLCLAVIASIVGNCNNSRGVGRFSTQTIEYQTSDNEYSVVVVEGKGLTMTEAKKLAQTKAAEMAYEDGYRYITFEVSQKTEVIKADTPWPDAQANQGNLYKELILDNDFSRDQVARQRIPNEQIYQAQRFVFKADKTKTNWRAIDVCTLTPCN